MNTTTTNFIRLDEHKQPAERIVLRAALLLFGAVRAIASQAKEAPGILSQAASDVKSAWEQSSRPNV